MRSPPGPFALACLGLAGAVVLAGGCSRSSPGPQAGMERRYGTASPRVIDGSQPVPRGGGTYKVGEPYLIDGRWYTPREEPGYDRTGMASFYADDFHGRRTSNGEVFDMWALSAAHPTLPMPSLVYVTNIDNGRTLLLRVNDRGPYVSDRIIDLSKAAARYLGFESRGTARVRVRFAGPAPLSGDDRNEQRFLANQPWFRVALSHAP